MTFFFHIASHRTGSTHFQQTLQQNAQFLENVGWKFHKVQEDNEFRSLTIKYRQLSTKLAESPNAVNPRVMRKTEKSLLRIYRENVLSSDTNKIISYEGYLGGMNAIAHKGIYSGYGNVIDFIARALADTDFRIGLSIRSYDDFIESNYKYLMRTGKRETFEDYTRELESIGLDWLPIVRRLIDTFGKERVLVWSFEQYRADTPGFYKWLFDQLGIENTSRQNSNGPAFQIPVDRRNESCSGPALRIELRVNQMLNRLVADRPRRAKYAHAINLPIETVFNQRRFGKPILLNPQMRKKLRAQYDEDIQTISSLSICRL